MIAAKGLTQHGEAGALLEDVTFEIRASEIYCLIASPAAVESAVEIAAGVRPATSGLCTLAGYDVLTSQHLARRHVTIVTRHARLYASQRVRDNVQFFVASFSGHSPTSSAIDNAMRRVGVPERDFGRSASSVPVDVATRLWLAIALLRETPAVILDEPTLRLDSRAASELREAIRELRFDGRAVLVGTSDVTFASDVADRIGVIKQGRKVAEKTRSDLVGDGLTQFYLEHLGRLPPRDHHEWPKA